MSRWMEPPLFLRPSLSVRPWLVVTCVAGATVLPSYLNGALTVALPSIGAQIGLSPAQWAWPMTVLSLVNGAFLLLSGGLADAFGRRWMFLLGTAWMAVFSITLAFIRQSTPFIAMSAVIGFGAACLSPAGTGIIGESLPDGKFKNGAFAALGAGQPLGFIIGLLFGGVFGHNFAILYMVNAAAAAVFGFAAWTCLPRDGEHLVIMGRGAASREDLAILTGRQDDGEPRRAAPLLAFDWFGAILCTAGIVSFTLGIAFAGTERTGWSSVPVLSMVPVGASLMLSFFLWEMHVQRQSSATSEESSGSPTLRAPLIPPGIWSAPCFSALLATIFFSWLAFNTLTYYCTLYLQEVQELKPLPTSVRFLPMIGVGFIMNILGGWLVDKVNAIWLVLVGLTGTLASCLIYTLMQPTWGYAQGMLWVMALLVFTDILYPAAQLFACNTVGPRRAALAGSLFTVTTRLASSIGLAATSSLTAAVTERYAAQHTLTTPEAHKEALLAGYRAAGWFCSGCVVLSLVLAPLTLRKMGVVGKLTNNVSASASNATEHRGRTRNGTPSGANTPRHADSPSAAPSLHDEHIPLPLQPISDATRFDALTADSFTLKPIAMAHKRSLRADEAFLGSKSSAMTNGQT